MAIRINIRPVHFRLGHVVPGFIFFIWGLWHLLKNIKFYLLNPNSYLSLPWFPSSKLHKYTELYSIIAFFSVYIAFFMDLLVFFPHRVGPNQIFPTVEHCVSSLTYVVYGILAIMLDKFNPPSAYDLTNLLFAVVFGQQFLIFHLHSTDHSGVEAQYHWLLQVIIFVSFVASLLGTKYPMSFLNGFVRSTSLVFEGVWLIVMGYMLYTPSLVPEGCDLRNEGGHWTVQCESHGDLHRAKSQSNIQFSLCVIAVMVFAVALYLIMATCHLKKNVEYQILRKFEGKDEGDERDVEAIN